MWCSPGVTGKFVTKSLNHNIQVQFSQSRSMEEKSVLDSNPEKPYSRDETEDDIEEEE